MVFYRAEGKIRTFTAHTVLTFAFFDDEAGITRTFDALGLGAPGQQGRKVFFEIAVEGDLTLARKGKFANIKKGQTNLPPLSSLAGMAQQQEAGVVYAYYLKGKNGLTPIRHFRRQVLPLMADREEEMQAFMQKFDFPLSNPLSYILLINYYNQLKKEVLTKVD
ncbi:hypothetical protein BH24BAC1_BH24BAC1_38790 [soil metagenome]